jgi:hypothetical protein
MYVCGYLCGELEGEGTVEEQRVLEDVEQLHHTHIPATTA